jgi:hypothetical protein
MANSSHVRPSALPIYLLAKQKSTIVVILPLQADT